MPARSLPHVALALASVSVVPVAARAADDTPSPTATDGNAVAPAPDNGATGIAPAAPAPQPEGFASPVGPLSTVLALRAGPAFALAGGVRDSGFVGGGWIDARAGFHTQWGVTLALEATGFFTTRRDVEVTDVAVGGVLRYTPFEQSVVHPFGEVMIDLGWLTLTDLAFGSQTAGLRPSTGAALGLEIDLSRHLSLELALRADVLFDQHVWNASPRSGSLTATAGAPDVWLTPVVGGSFYAF